MVFDNFGHDIGDVQAGSTYLLRDEARFRHARRGIDFEHHDLVVALLILRDDIVDADDAVAMQDVIDATGLSSHSLSCLRRQTGRRDFLNLSVVFRIIVEELIVGHHLCCRQHDGALLGLIDANGDLRSVHESLNHHLLVFHERRTEGRSQTVEILHLRHTKAGTVGSRFHEARHAHRLEQLLFGKLFLLTMTDEDAGCNVHTIAGKVFVQDIFVEGQRLHQYAAGAIGQVEEFEIALHDTILARSTVDGDIGIVEPDGLAVEFEGEIVLVDFRRLATLQIHMPVEAFDIDDIDIVAFFVEEGIDTLCRAQGYIVF